jgi:hypothetical protein
VCVCVCVYIYIYREREREREREVLQLLLESFQTLIVVTASVEDDERGGQGHISASLLHQSAM